LKFWQLIELNCVFLEKTAVGVIIIDITFAVVQIFMAFKLYYAAAEVRSKSLKMLVEYRIQFVFQPHYDFSRETLKNAEYGSLLQQ